MLWLSVMILETELKKINKKHMDGIEGQQNKDMLKCNVKSHQDKMLLTDSDNAIPLHFSQFFGQCASLDIQVIRQLLAVKGNIEFAAVLLQGNRIEIRKHPAPDCLRSCVKASFGKQQIFMSKKIQQV